MENSSRQSLVIQRRHELRIYNGKLFRRVKKYPRESEGYIFKAHKLTDAVSSVHDVAGGFNKRRACKEVAGN